MGLAARRDHRGIPDLELAQQKKKEAKAAKKAIARGEPPPVIPDKVQ